MDEELPPTPAATAPRPAATPDAEQLKRKRQPRNSACQGCAQLKMKCITMANGRCERCNRMDRECFPAVPKPRKRQTQSGVGLDTLQVRPYSNLTLIDTTPRAPLPPPPPPKFELPQSSRQDHPAADSPISRLDIRSDDSNALVSSLTYSLGNVAACEELLRGIDYNFVSNSFIIFRQFASYFPFVELSPDADVMSMISERPVLTVAVCIVASASRPDAQSRLSQVFKYALSTMVMFNGQRSIDLLTGLLVYLAWHHHYMAHQQICQMLGLLAGMAADLGLYQSPLIPSDTSASLERDRAFVGCYYLCSSLSVIGLDRPNPLRWTDNLRKCADNASAGAGPSIDHTVVALLELSRAISDFEGALPTSTTSISSAQPHYMDYCVRAINQRLKALKRQFPSLGETLPFTAASIHTYRRLFHVSESPDPSMVIQCACAIKEFLDDILARSPSTLYRIAIVDWANLLEILLLMADIARLQLSPGGWESGALTSMLQPDVMLDTICSHMASAPNNDLLPSRHAALLEWFERICAGIKRIIAHDKDRGQTKHGRSYERQRQSGSQNNANVGNGDYNVFRSFANGVLDRDSWNNL